MDAKLQQDLEILADPGAAPHRREAALVALAKARAAEALPAAVAALDVPALHDTAVRYLKGLATDEARSALLERLERAAEPDDRAELAALSDLGWSAPWPPDAARRAAAIARKVLERGPQGASEQTLCAAVASLGELRALARLPEAERAQLARSLEKVALDPDPDGPVFHRYSAIGALQALGTAAAVPILERCLDLPERQEVERARKALLELDLPEARKVVVDRGLRAGVAGPLALFALLNLGGIAVAAAALRFLFAAPWPWAIGIAAMAALPAVPSVVHYWAGWRPSDLWEFKWGYALFSPAILGPGAALCLELWHDWGWAGHLLAVVLVLGAVLNLLVFFARALGASSG